MSTAQATMLPAEGVRDELRVSITIPLPRDPFEQAAFLGKIATPINIAHETLTTMTEGAAVMQKSIVTTRPPKKAGA
jgi:hypothetical protein